MERLETNAVNYVVEIYNSAPTQTF